MSEHTFRTKNAQGDPVTVKMGYDLPLDYVFCTAIAEDGEILYSNLYDADAGTAQQEVEYFRPVLENLGIHVPISVFREVAADQRQRIGNRVVNHRERPLAAFVRWVKKVLVRPTTKRVE